MKYRPMGSLGWDVSALGFGAMRLPTRRFNRMRADSEASIRLIRHGIDLGINYIDTAFPYHLGDSERIVGQALQDGYRNKVHLVTKLFMPLVRQASDYDRYLAQQTAKLQTDYLDIYLFHALNAGFFEKVKRLGLIERALEAKRQGRIRHIGFSFHDTLPVFREIVDFFEWDIVQIQYNYMDTGIQATTAGLEYAHSKGMAVAIMEPLRGGSLADPPAEARAVMRRVDPHRTPVDWALQYLWNRPEVSVVLSGMNTRQQIDENCASADRSGVGSVTPEEAAAFDALVAIYRQRVLVPCTACGYCMPCPVGVNIPQNFGVLNNFSSQDGRFLRWMERFNYRRLASKKGKVDRQNPNGDASLCVRCGKCLEKCPQQIVIPDELAKVQAILGRGERIDKHFE